MSLRQVAVAVFCLWHMTATAVYSISGDWDFAPFAAVKDLLQPHVRGYVLLTSQWQQWNLFSPDPLRRVTRYAVERQNGTAWIPVLSIDENIQSWRRASMTKALRRLEDRERNDLLILRLLAIVCCDAAVPAGTPVRLQRHYYVLPYLQRAAPIAWWRSYVPEWNTDTMGETTCGPPEAMQTSGACHTEPCRSATRAELSPSTELRMTIRHLVHRLSS